MDTVPELVSIILPTYNRAHLLPAAIESVLTQTYQNWELLIWNDGSSDETFSVMSSFIDPRIKRFTDENHGKSYVLNRCLELAQGELIAFLDDDDQWFPEKLEVQVEAMTKWTEIDLFFANFFNIEVEAQTQEDGFGQTSKGLTKLKTQRISKNWWLINQGFLEGITRDNFIAFDSVMIRKNATEQVGCFNENLKNSEDFEFWWRFELAGLQAAYTDQVVLKRIKYPGSLSGRSICSLLQRLEMLNACKDLAAKQDRGDLNGLLIPLYRNTWHNLITAYGKEKDLKSAFSAFRNSLDYGFRPGALRLVAGVLFNMHKGDQL